MTEDTRKLNISQRRVLARVEKHALIAKADRALFEDSIRRASRNGIPVRAIAQAAGLSSSRVHQIVHGR